MFLPRAGADLGENQIILFSSKAQISRGFSSSLFLIHFLSRQKNGSGFDKNDTFFYTSTHKVIQPGSNVHRELAGILFYTFPGTTVVGTGLCSCFQAAEV